MRGINTCYFCQKKKDLGYCERYDNQYTQDLHCKDCHDENCVIEWTMVHYADWNAKEAEQ